MARSFLLRLDVGDSSIQVLTRAQKHMVLDAVAPSKLVVCPKYGLSVLVSIIRNWLPHNTGANAHWPQLGMPGNDWKNRGQQKPGITTFI